MFGWKKQKTADKERAMPKHIAIIMDGNGRYAKERSRPRINGHYEGMQNVKKITRHASDIGIKYLTLYAFSTENWSRPRSEVSYLMKLPGDFLGTFLPELIEKNVRVLTIGKPDELPDYTVKAVSEAVERTKDNTGLNLVFALNYGGRDELVRAIRLMSTDVSEGTLDADEIDQGTIDQYLMTWGMPEPEMMIRTSGEYRLSNFLLWQSSYSELFFTDTFWPEYTTEELDRMISQYQKRSRRFGGIDEEEV